MHGIAWIGYTENNVFTLDRSPTGWAKGGDPLIFAHELGHILGCNHDRARVHGGGMRRMSNYGYIMKGSATGDNFDGKLTIMAYENGRYRLRIPRFSKNARVKGESFRLGNRRNDNREQILLGGDSIETFLA